MANPLLPPPYLWEYKHVPPYLNEKKDVCCCSFALCMGVYMYICVCICMYMCVYICVVAHVGDKVGVSCLLGLLSTLFSAVEGLPEPRASHLGQFG